MVEYPYDFGNGYKVQTVYANMTVDGVYGDIYDFRADVDREHPGADILVGYCVIAEASGLIPDGCNDWNESIAEAIRDYEEHIIPFIQSEKVLAPEHEDLGQGITSSELNATDRLINAMSEYALENSWTDAEFVDALRGLGVTYEGFCHAGRGEFAKGYFDEGGVKNTPEQGKITVPTPLGDIVVTVKTDTEYPGVYVDLKGEKVKDILEMNACMLTTIEYDPLKEVVQSVVYGDGNSEEPTYIVEHENVEKEISLEEKIQTADEIRDSQELIASVNETEREIGE